MHYVIVDIETTGGSPKESKITEISMFKHDGEKIIDEFTTLINPGMKIPAFIVNFTGITDEMVATAPFFYQIAKEIVAFSEGCVFVAHNIAFDYGMVRHEFKELGYDYRLPHMCTVKASRVLIPGHDSYSLGKLTKELGINLVGRHRARGDAHATALLFELLYQTDKNHLGKFIQHELNPMALHPKFDLNSLEEIPNKVGIYRFFDETNRLIYIGKSIHVKKRIEQHLKNTKTKKAAEMVKEICRVEFELVGSEIIALIYESQLIKQHQPKFNRSLRKSNFPYGLYSYQDESNYTQLFIQKSSGKTGPSLYAFASKKEGDDFLMALCEKFELCQKLCHLYPTKSACFSYQIKKCKGACLQEEPSESYNARVDKALESLDYEVKNGYILDQGRQRNEKSVILIENGSFKGFGYLPFYALKKSKSSWANFIEYHPEDKDTRMILLGHLKRNDSISIIAF